jgi:hypothetical protein
MPEMTPVSSSNIAAVGYDEQAGELTVEFHSGQTYVYDGISPETYRALLQAPSIGSFFYANIRSGSYRQA